MKMKKYIGLSMVAGVLLVAGCSIGTTEEETSDNGKMSVVATTTMIADLVDVIGGDKVEVEGLMGPGVDPHGYQATASDVTKMTKADIVAYNGIHLEGKMGDIFEELGKQDKTVFVIEESINQEELLASEDASLAFDPHIWFSVDHWKTASNYITDELSAVDSENKDFYEKNNEEYQKELDELATYIEARVEEVPENSRFLVTAHDAFHYFGEQFDFEVVGLQGLNTQAEAGTKDVSDLAQFVVDHEIKAIFIESSVPTKTVESLQAAVKQKGWDVAIGGELYSDALGDKENDAETYLKMYRANIDTIVDALK